MACHQERYGQPLSTWGRRSWACGHTWHSRYPWGFVKKDVGLKACALPEEMNYDSSQPSLLQSCYL